MIAQLVRGQHIKNQEELRNELRAREIEVSQATLSRDIQNREYHGALLGWLSVSPERRNPGARTQLKLSTATLDKKPCDARGDWGHVQ